MCVDIFICTQVTYAAFPVILFKVWFFKHIQDLPNSFQLNVLSSQNSLNFQSFLREL